MARLNFKRGNVPTPSLVRAPCTPRLLLAASKVAFTRVRGRGNLVGLSGSVPGASSGIVAGADTALETPAGPTARNAGRYCRPLVKAESPQVPLRSGQSNHE